MYMDYEDVASQPDETNPGDDNIYYLTPEIWGLDPCFQAFNKMYVLDILTMSEYPTNKGAYAYRNHPVYRVDIIGVVVQVDQNQKCYMYGVDDGTGVITCCCWKEAIFKQKLSETDKESIKLSLPPCLHKKAEELVMEESRSYVLGDCIQVRGRIKVFREKREIVASYHNKLVDPMAVVSRMAELPNIYRNIYDKPYIVPSNIRRELEYRELGDSNISSEDQISYHLNKLITKYINTCDITEFSSPDIFEWEPVKSFLQRVDCTVHIQPIVDSCLTYLESNGTVCKRCDKPNSYEVLQSDCSLSKKISEILTAECSKATYSGSGCHLLRICDILQKTLQYSKISPNCVKKCLDFLVTQSDVIMTSDKHYMNVQC